MPTLTTRQQRAAASKRRTVKVILAVVGSLFLHVAVLLVLGWVVPRWPRSHLQGKGPSPLRLTILPPSPTPTPPAGPGDAARPEYMRTTDDQKSDVTPKDPSFISDKDTLAASEKPAAGDKPLPSQDGREASSFEFADTNYRPGKTASDAASNAPATPPQPKTDDQPKSDATPQPTATPRPNKSRPRRKDATPSTPAPDGELALAKAEPSASPEPPAPTPDKPEDETANTPPQPTRQLSRNPPAVQNNPSLVPNPGLPKLPGYQPQTRQSKVTGNINNRGKSAVMAIGTPLGRYTKAVQDSIGALWYYRVDQKMDVLSTGQVKIAFVIQKSGRTARVRVSSGAQNSALSSVSTGAVLEADIPPIPDEVAALLPGGEMEMELGFDMY